MAEPSVDRDIGVLTERSVATEKRLQAVEDKLDEVLQTLQHAKGGWKMLMVIGGGAAALGGLLASFWSTVTGKH
ncbi:MAG: hypothetical protein KGO96_13550 [Elusimicrobia bacterium]|nr:hypothetical protein [Elusimicrobiota bacterium]